MLCDFSPDIEVYSVDEFFLRVESVARLYGGVTAMGQQIRQRVKQWTELPVALSDLGSRLVELFVGVHELPPSRPAFAAQLPSEILRALAN